MMKMTDDDVRAKANSEKVIDRTVQVAEKFSIGKWTTTRFALEMRPKDVVEDDGEGGESTRTVMELQAQVHLNARTPNLREQRVVEKPVSDLLTPEELDTLKLLLMKLHAGAAESL